MWPKVSLFRIPPPLCIFLAPFLVHNFVFGAGITPYVPMTKSFIELCASRQLMRSQNVIFLEDWS